DDVTLFVELAENRMEETVGFEIRPQLQAIRRHRIEVRGDVGVLERVDTEGAGAIDDLAELVRHDVLAGRFHRFLPRLFELGDFCVVAAGRRATRGVVRGIRLIDSRERGLLGTDVARADALAALERHVLEHVREPGDPRHFLRRPGTHYGCKRKYRRFRPLHYHDGQ